MKRRSITATLVVGTLALAACGSDETSEEADATSAATDAPTDDTAAATDAPTEATDAPTEATDAPTDATDAPAATPDWPDKLTLTLTPSQEAGGLVDTAEPLAQALTDALGIEVDAIVPNDYNGVIVALQADQAQIAGGLGPSQMVRAQDEAGATLALQAVRFGSSQYVTQWFTNDPDTFCADEPVANEDGWLFCNGVDQAVDATDGPIGLEFLPEVAGKNWAIVDQGSTSGFQVPALELLNAGVDPFNDVNIVEGGGHDGAIQAVYDGDADVGVSFNDARSTLVETVPDVGEKVVVFGWSEPIPNDGFALAASLPADLQQAITDALVAFAATEEGATTLFELYEIDGLVPVPEGSYDIIRDLQVQLGDQLG